jgi:cleavage stimulation factor subunit 2
MSVEEKQARSVFVGNIPHGTTEEQMKDLFSTVGTVLSFRIVYDRETGNPKGYGFAEYSDIEMAQSAIRNLNAAEFSGRTLRVDKASSQADELRMIHQQTGGPPIENPYGENVSAEKAPEAISRAVASLPPEQMYELMKQMKLCIQNNMNEARTMLLNNPQLAYALLQAQVIMKIVEPQVAMALLHRKPDQIPPIMPSNTVSMPPNLMRAPLITPQPLMPPALIQTGQNVQPTVRLSNLAQPTTAQITRQPGFDHLDPRFQQGGMQQRTTVQTTQSSSQNSRQTSSANTSTSGINQLSQQQQQQASQQQISPQQPSQQQSPSSATTNSTVSTSSNQITSVDQEKAALIMQVLQLRDDQIAMLPLEQRQSILMLKEQIAQSAGGLI